jgi:hypothetical protein
MQRSAALPYAALATAILLTACGPRQAVGGTRPAIIPWTATVPGPPPTPSPPPTPTPLAMRFCVAADLAIREGRTGAAAGTSYTTFVFTNRSATECQLQGVPLVQVLDSVGRPVVASQDNLPGGDGGPVALLPGMTDGGGITEAIPGQAQLSVGIASVLCLPRAGTALAVSLPNGGGRLTIPWDFGAYAAGDCGGGIYVPPFADALPHLQVPEPPSDFAMELFLPASVAIGQTLKYQVRLANVSGHDIAFTTCPTYIESTKGGTANFRVQYVLNCRPIGLFKAGETVTLAMEFPMSATSPVESLGAPRPGVNPVWWGLDWPHQQSGGRGTITLTTASS